MIVGTTKLNYGEIKGYIHKPQELKAYCTTLVPLWARHIDAIVNNQMYYVAIRIRDMLSIPYKLRQEMITCLIKDVQLTGVVSSFTSITDIIGACNKEQLSRMIEVKLNGEKNKKH